MKSTPGRSRTGDLRFRKPLLYPTELREHFADYSEFGVLLGDLTRTLLFENTTVYTTFSGQVSTTCSCPLRIAPGEGNVTPNP